MSGEILIVEELGKFNPSVLVRKILQECNSNKETK